MTWGLIELLFGLAIGVVLGSLLGVRHAEDLHAENDVFRAALRHVRGVAIQHPELRLRGYLDQVLDDEAGS